ncbi:MAG TPA: M56 family metallopeptidase [Rhodanobacteraceae bacterium]|nr:M56 family metallopeptidase [Rhodanobacteraceae bacterium]
MMPITTQTLLAWVDAVGWTLLHFLWQGALLGLVYRVLRPLCHGVGARYRLGMLTLSAMLLCPIVTFVYLWPAPALAPGVAAALPSIDVTATDAGLQAAAGGNVLESWLPWLVAIWFVGASAIAIRAFNQWRRLAWLVRNATIPLADCATVLARLRARFGIRRPVRLLGSLGIDTPMLVGWLRPTILLPISMLSGFTPQQIELIIAHELGHVRRWDYLANLLQVVIETILFYHPIVHWISRDVREARESCCDDLVLALAEGSPVVYASALADLEELRLDTTVAAPALAASGGVLLTRIRRIVGAQAVMHDTLPRTGGWPVALVLAASLLAVLRLHGLPSLATTLLRVPVASTAAITGNTALLNSAPAAAPVAPASVESAPARASATVESTAIVVQSPPRPRIGVASVAFAPPRVTNIRERLSPMPSVPEPVAAAEPSNANVAAPAAVATAEPAKRAAVAMPIALQRVQPDYPVREKIRGVTGKVELQFGLAADGSVSDVSVLESTPEHVFDRTAIAALKQWRFATPVDTGQRYTQTFAFTRSAAPATTESCREVIGSHICRHVAGDETDK